MSIINYCYILFEYFIYNCVESCNKGVFKCLNIICNCDVSATNRKEKVPSDEYAGIQGAHRVPITTPQCCAQTWK